LIHAQNVSARRESARLGLGFCLWFACAAIACAISIAIAIRAIRGGCLGSRSATSAAAPPRRGFFRRHEHRERRAGAGDLAALVLQHPQQVGLRARPRIVRRKHIGGRTLGARLLDGALGLQIEITQEQLVVRGEIRKRRQQAGLLVIIVVAL
jgi:hypothetical protein